jgi:hypothetical protein
MFMGATGAAGACEWCRQRRRSEQGKSRKQKWDMRGKAETLTR